MITYDEIITGLISANIKNMPQGAILFYKNYEIDTEITQGMTLEDVIKDIKRQIYETEKVPKDELPITAMEPLSAMLLKVHKLKDCIATSRKHINESAETVTDKCFMLEKMSYNLDIKIDDIINYIEEMLDKKEQDENDRKTNPDSIA
jgi:hypothetical protein